jgi:GMP synthase-like glutamine amidotransferase
MCRGVLIFRHVPFEGAGHIENVLEARGIPFQYVDLYRDSALPFDPGEAAGLLFLGGPMSVNDDLPYLRREMDLIAAAVGRGQPVLGICLGAQMIAKAAGARVYPNPEKEIGWFDIHLTDAGAADPLLGSARRTETVLHWHGETFDLPGGAELLASSEHCTNQAYRLGNSVWGLQFHLEVTPEMLAEWCVQEENCGDVKELDPQFDPRQNAERLNTLAQAIFGNWCELHHLPD